MTGGLRFSTLAVIGAAVLSVMAPTPACARSPVQGPSAKHFQRVVDTAYARYRDLRDGSNADYIPILTETPSDLFGVVIVTRDGKVYAAGDTDYVFSVQSISKPFTAALVLSEQGPA
ncbi:MAG: glutaminase, partial [Burkholderiales bacterium]|nr:glutaminase [Burkholderiales bacterium]